MEKKWGAIIILLGVLLLGIAYTTLNIEVLQTPERRIEGPPPLVDPDDLDQCDGSDRASYSYLTDCSDDEWNDCDGCKICLRRCREFCAAGLDYCWNPTPLQPIPPELQECYQWCGIFDAACQAGECEIE